MQIDNLDLGVGSQSPVHVSISDDIVELDFSQVFGCHPPIYWLQKVADNISQLRNLTTLIFTHAVVGDEELKIIAKMIESCPSITKVVLDKSCESSCSAGYRVLSDTIKSKSLRIEVRFVDELVGVMRM